MGERAHRAYKRAQKEAFEAMSPDQQRQARLPGLLIFSFFVILALCLALGPVLAETACAGTWGDHKGVRDFQ